MAKSNKDVAYAFVHGEKSCKGSNTTYTKYDILPNVASLSPGAAPVPPVLVREFMSYSTVVAVIRDDILWWNDYRSNSTQQQLSYVHSAWRGAGVDKPSVCVPFPEDGAGTRNVGDAVVRAMNALSDMLTPRIQMKTKVKHWALFLSRLEFTERLLTLPCYGSRPSEAVMERLAIARVIRDGNEANPAGLDTVITNVRAVYALEG